MDSDILVLYETKTGYTKKYAEIIAKHYQCDINNVKLSKSYALYNTIIIALPIRMGKLLGIKQINKLIASYPNKNIIVLAVGIGLDTPENYDKILFDNFNIYSRSRIKLFYLRGGNNYSSLKFYEKLLLRFVTSFLKNKKERTEDDNQLMYDMTHDVDFVSEDNLKEVYTLIDQL